MIVGLSSAVLILVWATAFGPQSALTLASTSLSANAGTPSADEAAQQAFRAGVDAARQERWPEARALFEKAYALSPRPVVLINLAGAQARTGRLTEAAKNYRRILNDESAPETASFRRAAAEVLPALEARIPRVRLRPSGLTPADVIQIDGDSVDTDTIDDGHPLDPGEHTLVVRHAGTERARVLFTLAERELRQIDLPLPALVQRPPPSPAPLVIDVPTQTVPDPSETEGRRSRSLWRSPWTWTALAVVVVGSSVATYVVMDGRSDPFIGNISPGRIDVR